MSVFSIQYLEDGPKIASISPHEAQTRLRAALESLPINMVLLGWNLPDALVDACAEACHQAGTDLYRWHPLLTGDGTFVPKPAWQTIGMNGAPVPGFRNMPEFTFVCPNRPPVQEAIQAHVRDVLQDDRFQGIFLDRMRYPSPAENPAATLGCFCEDCQRAAAKEGIDLEAARASIARLLTTQPGLAEFMCGLLAPNRIADPGSDIETLLAFLDFRSRSVSRFIQDTAKLAHESGKAVGLDCFSPALAHMVGQDLRALSAYGEWTKIMSYGHTFGPAGMPYEFVALADWLVEEKRMGEQDALALLADVTNLPLPQNRDDLRETGLSPQALGLEAQRARDLSGNSVLAGIELVEIEGITRLNEAQISADVTAFREAGVDGLAISWDLWEIPLERLELIRANWP